MKADKGARPTVNNAFEYNPRCIRRDFRPGSTNTSLTYPRVINLLNQPDLHTFQATIEGMHPRGHQGIGGMNDDLYAGNGDPAFYFHHAQVRSTIFGFFGCHGGRN
jgi:tyrosinase